MRIIIALVAFAFALAAQSQAGPHLWLNLNTDIGSDSMAQIRLAPKGCWEGLLLSVAAAAAPQPPAPSSRRGRVAETTVEVWDVVFQETRFQETFRLFRDHLLQSIQQNWQFAPPSHGRIDASIRARDGSGAGTDMAMVQSLQQRFNALPPNGSPVRR